ncbi:nitrate reductase molybdenum cofactor assembly chaperone [Actinospica robiniae]|uniref:nitrate reductase molybdenum cofactor assembly chaperone n=1 Tax=Actinospica robiniae TaxID=304901 RepID=UPI000419E156|nr:nitrate reductase molybdenum cofactor assembly chaperone [Actinospica robiniae]
MSAAQAVKLASLLLQYPRTELFTGIDTLDAFAADLGPKAARESFARFLGWLRATEPTAVAQHYVETFDLRRRCALYLTYYRYGDTRKRGMAMLEFKTAYRAAGFAPNEDELPDYLPMVLEFASLTDRGMKLIHGHRADLELLRRALVRADSPYAEVLAAVCAQVPRLSRRELSLVSEAWQAGPPREEVGIEPFAPPGYLAGYGSRSGNDRPLIPVDSVAYDRSGARL